MSNKQEIKDLGTPDRDGVVSLPNSMIPLMASVGSLLVPPVSKQAKNVSFHLHRVRPRCAISEIGHVGRRSMRFAARHLPWTCLGERPRAPAGRSGSQLRH